MLNSLGSGVCLLVFTGNITLVPQGNLGLLVMQQQWFLNNVARYTGVPWSKCGCVLGNCQIIIEIYNNTFVVHIHNPMLNESRCACPLVWLEHKKSFKTTALQKRAKLGNILHQSLIGQQINQLTKKTPISHNVQEKNDIIFLNQICTKLN